MKYCKILTLVLLFLVGLTGLAHADGGSLDIDYKKIEIDNDEITSDVLIHAERGDVVDIDVTFESNNYTEDVRVEAWIEAYEYDDIEDKTSLFDVRPGITYTKHLRLVIPEDIEKQTYDIRIEVSARGRDVGYDDHEIALRIEGQRHGLSIYDVIFRPGTSLEAGDVLSAEVRVENLGDKKEEDIKVTLSVLGLGVSDSVYINELVAYEDENDDDEEDSASSKTLYVRLPKDATSGKYDAVIDVEYNRGHDIVSETYVLNVKGKEAVAPEEEFEGIISVDVQAQNVPQGEGVVYRVMFANLGEQAVTYSLDVSNVQAWATARVDPGFVTVQPGSTGEMFIYIVANENAPLGKYSFNVKVNANSVEVQELNLEASIVEGKAVTDWSDVKKGLQIGFIVLVVLLVILGLVIAFSRLRGGPEGYGEEPAEPGAAEGQTYYQYPRY